MSCGSYNKKSKKSKVSALSCVALICLCFCFKSISPSSKGAVDLNNSWYTPTMNDEFSGMSKNLDKYLEHADGIIF